MKQDGLRTRLTIETQPYFSHMHAYLQVITCILLVCLQAWLYYYLYSFGCMCLHPSWIHDAIMHQNYLAWVWHPVSNISKTCTVL